MYAFCWSYTSVTFVSQRGGFVPRRWKSAKGLFCVFIVGLLLHCSIIRKPIWSLQQIDRGCKCTTLWYALFVDVNHFLSTFLTDHPGAAAYRGRETIFMGLSGRHSLSPRCFSGAPRSFLRPPESLPITSQLNDKITKWDFFQCKN